jgi:undecaprenyl-diphosphatase
MEKTMDFLKAFLLGLIQGLTEFLPVSSSGHLVVTQKILGLEGPILFFDVMLHFGTLMAIFIVFAKDIRLILSSMISKNRGQHLAAARLGWLAILGTIPIGITGILFHDWIERAFESIPVVGSMFIATGFMLFSTRKLCGKRKENELRVRDAIWVGICQTIALLPGVSRSGMTIGGGLWLGIRREVAVRLSFMMAIPAILGALVLKIFELPEQTQPIGIGPMLIGTLTALLVGLVGLKCLIRLTISGRLHWFAYYLWALGLVMLSTFFSA